MKRTLFRSFIILVICWMPSLTLRAQPACVSTDCCCGNVTQLPLPGGNFEGAPFAPPTSYTTFYAGETFHNWTVQSGSVDLLGPNTPNFAFGNPNGPSQHIDLNGFTNGTITTTITGMVVGFDYTIVLWYAKNPGTPIANCNIRVAGGAWLNQSWSATNNGGDIWLERCFTFTAQASTAELRFIGSSNVPVAGMLLDDITIWVCPQDNQAPQVSNPPPPNVFVDCPTLIPAPTNLMVTDNCSNNPTIQFTETVTPQACYYNLQRTWSVSDDCDNVATIQQNIQVQDTQAPVFLSSPMNITVGCTDNVLAQFNTWVSNYGGAIASDNCDEDIEWDINVLTPLTGACGIFPVSFTIRDDCFNSTVRTAFFVVNDPTPPVLLQVAMDQTLFCPENGTDSLLNWLTEQGGAQASDPCGPITWSNDFSGDFSQPVVEVTFTATDRCQNSVTTTATFTQIIIKDTVTFFATTCDPAQAGVSQYSSFQGACETVYLTTTNLLPSNLISQEAFSCDPADVGVFTQNFINQYGCDSTIITTVSLLPKDDVFITETTCNPNASGIFTQLYVNQYGCDSVVYTTVLFDPGTVDTVRLTATNCDPTQTGVSVQTLSNQFGCDSIVITTTALLQPDTTLRTAGSCDPTQTGVSVQTLTNQFGCDSIVITTTALLQPDTTQLAATSCDPTQTGVSVQTLTNQFGCDSIVITTTALLQPDTTQLAATSCDPTQTGVSVQTLANQFGCDSVIVTTTFFDSTNCVQQTVLKPENPGCADIANGRLSLEVLAGAPPFAFQWSNNLGNTGTGVIYNLNQQIEITGLPAGDYTVTITGSGGGNPEILTANLTAAVPIVLQVQTDRPACKTEPATLIWTGSGGTAPYLLKIDGWPVTGSNVRLPEGDYIISLEDSQGCQTDTLLVVETTRLPAIALPPDTSIVLGSILRIEAVTNLTLWSDISWQPLSDSTCATCLTQEWIPLRSGSISVTIMDTAGCTASSTMNIFVKRTVELYIPNVFSPNNDGINDTWQIYTGNINITLRTAAIYDRWGGLIYAWEGAVAPDSWPGWDGNTADKQSAGAGVYAYLLQIEWADGTIEQLAGDVTILR